MKNGYFFLLIALGCLIGCQKADHVFPAPDGLYQRWKAENTDSYITFLREGIVLYGVDGKQVSCCSGPGYFRRDGMTLVFKDIPAKPLPFQLPQPTGCDLVYCLARSDKDWQILSLAANRLVLNAGNGSDQTYIAAP